MVTKDYTGVEVRDGLEGLRSLREMYIGGTGIVSNRHAPRGLTQLIQEILSNSVDEFLVGFGKQITVIIHEDNSVTITDNGRGMPKGPSNSFEEVIKSCTKPHASGKFNNHIYGENGVTGLHGIGVKATNATSKYLTVHALSASSKEKDGKLTADKGFEEYEITFHLEDIQSKKIINKWSKKDIEPIETSKGEITVFKDLKTGEIHKRGTSITFLPDDGRVSDEDDRLVFESINWNNDDLFKRFETSSFLNSGLDILFIDERKQVLNEETDKLKPFTREWYFKNGIEDYVKELASETTTISEMKDPISMKKSIEINEEIFDLQCSIMFTENPTSEIYSYANGVHTSDGGPHEDGFKSAFTKAINNYAKENDLNKVQKGKKTVKIESFNQSEVLEGIICAFEIRVPSKLISFESQTKEKLATALAKNATYDIIYSELTDWLYDHPNKSEKIIEHVVESKYIRDKALEVRKDVKGSKGSKSQNKLILSGKMKLASSNNPEEKELFLVEGKSAGGNLPCNSITQSIITLRGKVLNIHDIPLAEVYKNEELTLIENVVGTGIGPSFKYEDLLYGKIIITPDADPDGGHIATLLLSYFYRYMKPLITFGHIYVAKPPLFKATKYKNGNIVETKLFYSDKEMDENRTKLVKEKWIVKRFKGLGEMGTDELGDAVSNKETRHLTRVMLNENESDETNREFKILMGKDSTPRKIWLEENATFSQTY